MKGESLRKRKRRRVGKGRDNCCYTTVNQNEREEADNICTHLLAEIMEDLANAYIICEDDFNEEWGPEALGDIETPGGVTPTVTDGQAGSGDSTSSSSRSSTRGTSSTSMNTSNTSSSSTSLCLMLERIRGTQPLCNAPNPHGSLRSPKTDASASAKPRSETETRAGPESPPPPPPPSATAPEMPVAVPWMSPSPPPPPAMPEAAGSESSPLPPSPPPTAPVAPAVPATPSNPKYRRKSRGRFLRRTFLKNGA